MNSNKNILAITGISFVLLSIFALIIIGGSYGIYTFITSGQSHEESSFNNSNSIEEASPDAAAPNWKCSVCGRAINGNGYEEVSDGVWKPCHEPIQCQICSPDCGMKHTRQINSIINNSSDRSVCTNCGLGHYNSDGFCGRCGAASAERVNESKSKLPDCEVCHGTGVEESTIGDKRICPTCHGTGKISY